MKYRILVLLLCVLSAAALHPLDPSKTINQYVDEQWTTGNGLPGNSIVAIAQTDDGYLWVATRQLLCRFNGIKFKTYRLFNIGQEGYKEITSLRIDSEGLLWIGTRGEGLFKFEKEVFEIFSQKDGLSSLRVNTLFSDVKNNLWIGTDDGYINRMKNKEIVPLGEDSGLGEPYIYAVSEDSRGNLWVGTRGGGLYRYFNGKFVKTPIKDFEVYDVTAIHEDSTGELWIGTNRGLVRYDGKDARLLEKARGIAGHTIYRMQEDSDGNFWIGTGNGLFRIQRQRAGDFSIQRLMAGSVVRAIFEDREKSIWIGTDGRGLTRLRDGKISTVSIESGLPHEYVVFLHEDSRKNLRVGTMDGLVRFDSGRLEQDAKTIEFSEAVVGPICEDNDGAIWFGTYGSGLYRLQNGARSRFTISNGLLSDSIISLHCDSRGVLRVGTSRGLNIYRDGAFRTASGAPDALNSEVYALYETDDNTIWIGTDKGIIRHKNGTYTPLVNSALPPNLRTSYFYEDSDHVMWVGTKGNGLIRLTGENNVAVLTTRSGLYSNVIYQVFEDAAGYFWMSCDKGVFRVIKKSLNDVADGSLQRVESVHYGKNDGMKSQECSRWGQHSSIRTSDGRLLFGATKGISVINPVNMKINKIPPTVIIERVVVNNQSVELDMEQQFVFSSLDYIQFYFSASTLISPKKITFRYKLESRDEEWVNVKADQIKMAHYRDLEPGSYSFRVMAANSDGIWDEKGTSFTFRYSPGITQSMYFRTGAGVAVLLIAALLLFGVRKYRRYLKLKNKYKDSTLDQDTVAQGMKKLMYVMDIEKVYKDDGLQLHTLAKKIALTPHILSQLINEQLNKNFSDLVNGYRIDEAKKMLEAADEDTSILHICYEVGFNSKSAFYRAFKKFTGLTPSQFQKTLKNKP